MNHFNETPQIFQYPIRNIHPRIYFLKVIYRVLYIIPMPISTGLATRKCNNGLWGDPNVNNCEGAIFEEVRINVSPSALRHASH